MVVVFVSSSFQQDLHILLCFPSKAILSLPSATSGPWRCLTPQSSDKISSRVNSIRTCYIFNYGQRLDYGKGKGFLARVKCAVEKSRKEEKIGGYADISGVNIFS